MAGAKGRSGGARPNSGGHREGAGRKRKPAILIIPKVGSVAGSATNTGALPDANTDMLKLLQDIALGIIDANANQVRAAVAAIQYTHAKKGEGGKKEARQGAAEGVASKYSAPRPPAHLRAVK